MENWRPFENSECEYNLLLQNIIVINDKSKNAEKKFICDVIIQKHTDIYLFSWILIQITIQNQIS